MKRQQRRAAHATPGNNMSIGRDGLLVYGGGSITIDNNGGITITGPDGQIVGSGTINWTGTMTNTGPTNLNGPTGVAGTLNVTGNSAFGGTLDILGDTNISGDTVVQGTLNVVNSAAFGANVDIVSPGRLKIGDGLQMEPSVAGGGSINFLPSGGISAGLGRIILTSPDLLTVVEIGGGKITVNGREL